MTGQLDLALPSSREERPCLAEIEARYISFLLIGRCRNPEQLGGRACRRDQHVLRSHAASGHQRQLAEIAAVRPDAAVSSHRDLDARRHRRGEGRVEN